MKRIFLAVFVFLVKLAAFIMFLAAIMGMNISVAEGDYLSLTVCYIVAVVAYIIRHFDSLGAKYARKRRNNNTTTIG